MPLVVYFDEVGNPTLDDTDRDFPVFAIALFICEIDDYVNQITPFVNRLKFKWFNHEGVILHSRDIRKAQRDFSLLGNPSMRERFMNDLSALMDDCRYKLIAVAVRKDAHKKRYRYPADPYELALLFAMERLLSVLEGAGQKEVTVLAEKRGEREDRQLHVAFQRIVTAGSEFVSGERFREVRFDLKFLPKALNVVGTQMADLAAYPIARHVLDPRKRNPPFDIVRTKFCRQLKIFPYT